MSSLYQRMNQAVVKPVIYGGLALLALAPVIGCKDSVANQPIAPTAQHEQCKLSLHQVRAGIVSPEAYIDDLADCLPSVAEAQTSGILKGFIYQPSDKELEELLTELFFESAQSEQELQYLVQSSVNSYKHEKGKEVGVIIPGIIGVFGQRVPIYVAFTKELFSSPVINYEEDVESIVKHELQHVKDWYEGISLANVHLSYDTMSPETFRIEFLEQFMELRAVYRELEDVFRKRVETGDFSISDTWFGSQAANYFSHWNFLEEYPVTDLERKSREAQFKQFERIMPEKTNNAILIKFNLFGKQDVAIIEEVQ